MIELEDVSVLEVGLEEVGEDGEVDEDGEVEERESDRARCANNFIQERQSLGWGPPATVPW